MGDDSWGLSDRIKSFCMFSLAISSLKNDEKVGPMGMMTVPRGTSSTSAREEVAEVDSRDLRCVALRVRLSVEDESLINLPLRRMKDGGGHCLERGEKGGCRIGERLEASWERVSYRRGQFCINAGGGERPGTSGS